jgi:hypothetical protein
MQHRPVVSQSLDDTFAAEQEAQQKTVQALLARSENDVELASARNEVVRLREEIARKESQMGSTAPNVKESALFSERSGIAAREGQIAALENVKRPTRAQAKQEARKTEVEETDDE